MIGESRAESGPNGDKGSAEPIQRIAFVGNYIPRQCGIATFTTDLATAFANVHPHVDVMAVPMNDRVEGYDYPPMVRFEVEDRDLEAYRRAADFLNISNIDIISLQHEFGIYGGEAGDFILTLLKHVRAPVVTTLHTILEDPPPAQRRAMQGITRYSERFVVMSMRAVEFMKRLYGVDESRIDCIPHGIPDVPFVDPSYYKDQFGVEGRKVLLTFGLLSPGKGIEHVIQALPQIVRKHPEVVYLVVGATHPHVRMRDGENYRMSLRQMSERLGVSEQLVFHDHFVTLEELISFIGAADVYVTPYLSKEQSTSGTLAFAVGAGKAVVSTPYWHAEELLSDSKGIIVPFRSPDAIAESVCHLLGDDVARNTIRKRAYQYGRCMVWPAVAARYMESFYSARMNRHVPVRKPASFRTPELPEIRLDHLLAMTDDTGLLQHAIFTVPNYCEGYTIDDNARGLLAAVLLEEEARPFESHAQWLQRRYLAFLQFCYDPAKRRFHNFVSYDRKWLDDVGSQDSQGRALWALGAVVGRSNQPSLRGTAAQLFGMACASAQELAFPRSWAFAVIGIQEYLRTLSGDLQLKRLRAELAQRLFDLYQQNAAPDWRWFEQSLTYANAKLPHALLMAGHWTGNGAWRDAALQSLDWLMQQQTGEAGAFEPIGNRGWHRGEPRARSDEQPIEAHSSCSACLEAYRLTADPKWMTEAQRCFQWFLGRNHLQTPVYDSQSGGCRDGLHPDRLNENEGAESTLAFLLSLLEMRKFRQQNELQRGTADERHAAHDTGEPVADGAAAARAVSTR